MAEDWAESQVSFEAFILSLSTTAMVHLGLMADPVSGNKEANLKAAREMIDLIGLLQEKTKGNLTSTESQLIDAVLFDLRMTYVERAKEAK